MHRNRDIRLSRSLALFIVASVAPGILGHQAFGQSGIPIAVSSSVPDELNAPFRPGPPATGGAPSATPDQAAAFAWQEFIALNWPAVPQHGQLQERDQPAPESTCHFGDPSANCALLVWETFRSKVEIFPGNFGPPPGYDPKSSTFGYDALPAYNYLSSVSACDVNQKNDPAPWINLDESDQITLNNMYAGVVDPNQQQPGNSAPKLIRFLAKANRTQYSYVAQNQWWAGVPSNVVKWTKTVLENGTSPPAGSTQEVSLRYGTIEIKAAWRPLNSSEMVSGRFHTQTVRFYEYAQQPANEKSPPCYRDAVWGLVGLHIIQKTPSAPYFIYATFEQADNILKSNGEYVEDADGAIIAQPEPATATSPQVCLVDPKPSPPGPGSGPSTSGKVVLTDDPTTCKELQTATYCDSPGNQLYYRNESAKGPSGGNICVNKRAEAIPDYVVAANKQSHAAIAAYLQQNGIKSAPWLSYKLVNVQYFPYDKIPDSNVTNGSLYTAQPPYTATNPAPSSYYQANIVVETNRSLQLFSGGLSPNITTQWNQDGTMHKNVAYGGHLYNMGGCMGCHGAQGQNPAAQAGDFSVILARGPVLAPEPPALETPEGLTEVQRNRSLTK